MNVFAVAICVASLWSAAPGEPEAAPDGGGQPVELGRVPWLRDYAAGLRRAGDSGRPVMILFDEVPGCGTCKQYGQGPLSHPIVVDAASEFVPVAVYNNVSGPDETILKKYNEPAWNNPVVRFVDAAGKDIVSRHADDYTTGGLLARATEALRKAGITVPRYLQLVTDEYNPKGRETATFAMHCYWVGEQKLGELDGVLATRIGMLGGLEVVELDFDPTVLEYRRLVQAAKKFDCAQQVFSRTDEQTKVARGIVGSDVVRSDERVDTSTVQQYHLSKVPAYQYLPLTALQATKVNAAIASETDPDRYLSPGQSSLKKQLDRLLARNTGLPALAELKPDRSPAGISQYAARLAGVLHSR